MKKIIKLSLVNLSLLSIFSSCKEEENDTRPVLNNFINSPAVRIRKARSVAGLKSNFNPAMERGSAKPVVA